MPKVVFTVRSDWKNPRNHSGIRSLSSQSHSAADLESGLLAFDNLLIYNYLYEK